MKISVCIITYNQEKYIKKCLESAINQKTNYSFEIIIGEDCSTDKTRSICEEFSIKHPKLIRLLPLKPNLGMIGNWKRSILSCSGDYISICEGDDYWSDPYKLQKQVDFLEANPKIVLCAHSIFMDIKGIICFDVFRKKYKDIYVFNKDQFIYGNNISTVSTMFRNNIPNFSIQKCIKKDYLCCDLPLWLELANHGDIALLPERMAVYRDGVGVMSKMKQNELQKFINNLYLKHNLILKKQKKPIRFLVLTKLFYCFILNKIGFDLIKHENKKRFYEI